MKNIIICLILYYSQLNESMSEVKYMKIKMEYEYSVEDFFPKSFGPKALLFASISLKFLLQIDRRRLIFSAISFSL